LDRTVLLVFGRCVFKDAELLDEERHHTGVTKKINPYWKKEERRACALLSPSKVISIRSS
jgi:hypothetical protein